MSDGGTSPELPPPCGEVGLQSALAREAGRVGGEVSRRTMFQAMAGTAIAAAAAPLPAFAQNQPAVATAADYLRDPIRWGTAEVAGLFPAMAGTAIAAAAAPLPAFAQNQPAVATAADYLRDPIRWGTAEVAGLFP